MSDAGGEREQHRADEVGPPRPRGRRLQRVQRAGQRGDEAIDHRGRVAAADEREERLGHGALPGVARGLDPEGGQPERLAQQPLDHAHALHAAEREGRRAAREQPAAGAQAVAVADDLEPGERDDRARDRQQPCERDDARRDEQPLAGGVGEAVERLARHVAHDVLARGGDATGDRQEDAELRGGERGDEEGPRCEAQPVVGRRRRLGRVPERAAQRLRVAAGHGAQDDLRVAPAAGRLHAQLEHAEQALQRALGRVERGDPLAGDDLLVARQQPRPEMERAPVQRPGGRVPPHQAGDDDEHQAGDAVDQAARVARAGPDDDGDDERDRHLAQAAERLDEDARRVHAPRRAQRIGDDRRGPSIT